MKIEELLKDEAFLEALEKAVSDEDVLALFNGKGVTLTAEDLEKIRAEFGGGELSEDKLEDVAGGRMLLYPVRPITPLNPIVIWILHKLLRR